MRSKEIVTAVEARSEDKVDRTEPDDLVTQVFTTRTPEGRARLERLVDSLQGIAELERLRRAWQRPYEVAFEALRARIDALGKAAPPVHYGSHRRGTRPRSARGLIAAWASIPGLGPIAAVPPNFPAEAVEALTLTLKRGRANVPKGAPVVLFQSMDAGCADCGSPVELAYRDGAFRPLEPCAYPETPLTVDLPILSGELVFATDAFAGLLPDPVTVDARPRSRHYARAKAEALFHEHGVICFETSQLEELRLYRRSPTRFTLGRPAWRDLLIDGRLRLIPVPPRGQLVLTGLTNHSYACLTSGEVFRRMGGRFEKGEACLLSVPPGTYRFRLPIFDKRHALAQRRIPLTAARLQRGYP